MLFSKYSQVLWVLPRRVSGVTTTTTPTPLLRVASLGSGSAGNSTLIRSAGTTLLLDCGFTLKETVARLATLQLTLDDLDAILVSHEHSDHVRGLGPIARKCGAAVWITHGSFDAWRDKKIQRVNFCTAHQSFSIGDITIDPFPTPHDAAESCQYVFSVVGEAATSRFVALTDLGVCTPHIYEKLHSANALLIECNYDLEMLRNGPYPASLQSRIRSRFGHLGNQQAAQVLSQIDHQQLQTILLGHLSERNNTPELARATVSAQLENTHRVHVLEQHSASAWFDLSCTQTATPAQAASTTPATIETSAVVSPQNSSLSTIA